MLLPDAKLTNVSTQQRIGIKSHVGCEQRKLTRVALPVLVWILAYLLWLFWVTMLRGKGAGSRCVCNVHALNLNSISGGRLAKPFYGKSYRIFFVSSFAHPAQKTPKPTLMPSLCSISSLN
eukprot:2374803-Amphidinium_carterae.1